jgi:NAD(P)-dependent dehydrogenase (short-subunit alcohol dehydrogenase family)
VVRMINAFLPLLRRSPAGRIVNVTSKRGSIGEAGPGSGSRTWPTPVPRPR